MNTVHYSTTESGYDPVYGNMYDGAPIIIEDDEATLEEDIEQEGEVIYDREHEQIIEGDIPFIDFPMQDDTVH